MQVKEVRNLKRWFLIDQTLTRYNRKFRPITKQQLGILMAIYFLSISNPVVKTLNILAYLREYNKAIRPDILSRQLKLLERNQFIIRRINGRTSLFHLSVGGEVELKYLERLNRTCRR